MRSVAVVTGARSDWSYLLPVVNAIQADPDLRLQLIVTGMHLSPAFGFTVTEIEAANIPIADKVDMLLSADTAAAVAKSIGVGTVGLAQSFDRLSPDVLLLLGDRFETLAAAAAFLPFARPIAHIAGGERTEGAVDEMIRHALTKLSHIHFVATESYARRVIQMGEEPWRVHVSGAPSLDNIALGRELTIEELESLTKMRFDPAPILVTWHPETLRPEGTIRDTDELLAALDAIGKPVLFTAPNADVNGRSIIEAIEKYVSAHPGSRFVMNLGTAGYYAALRAVGMMVGNSSSGIIEAASFGLPVVNVGDRQKGRDCGDNVVHAAADRAAILKACERAASAAFRETARATRNPYGDGRAAARIVQILREADFSGTFMRKSFRDARDGSGNESR